MKKCPFCAEEIQDEAIYCKHCNQWIKKDGLPESSFTAGSQENWMKPPSKIETQNSQPKKSSYIWYLLLGAITGIGIGFGANKSLADQIGHSFTNIFIYGSISFAICALKNREYKNLWYVPIILISGFVFSFLIYGGLRQTSKIVQSPETENNAAVFLPTISLTESSPTPKILAPTIENPLKIPSPSTSGPKEDWRIPLMPGYSFSASDSDKELELSLSQAVGNSTKAIEGPIRWDYINIDASFKNVSDYYVPLMKAKKFQITQNYYNNETSKGFITFTSPDQLVYIQYTKRNIITGRTSYSIVPTNVIVAYKKICTQEEWHSIGFCMY